MLSRSRLRKADHRKGKLWQNSRQGSLKANLQKANLRKANLRENPQVQADLHHPCRISF
ncbi:MAG: pentapeptide repeat-containing protein [Parasporobacterium sp.]|nr:pentapeptide repeat-containing protein [Parasporobacterium sp.]